MKIVLILSLIFNSILFFDSRSFASVARPPQYIAMAFDGSLSVTRWEETRAFAAQMNRSNVPLHFTYFASGVYFLGDTLKLKYTGPGKIAGQSDIGFGGLGPSIATRLQEINAAAAEHNEIGSHLNGHFDGSKWLTQDWSQEFTVFYDLIFNAFANNSLVVPTAFKWNFSQQDIVGFRAPYLAWSPGLWQTLNQFKFRYDTSEVESPEFWPDHNKGFWKFPLATLRVAGTTKRTLSMDYNFYVAQSGAKDDLQNSALYEKEMYETYLAYFMKNYNGNRAPINIGHHFPLYNGGAYWNAMKSFAQKVCGLPEVECVTYKELADFMDKQTPSLLAAYKASDFPKLPPVVFEQTLDAAMNAGHAIGAKAMGFEFTPELQLKALEGDPKEAHENSDNQ